MKILITSGSGVIGYYLSNFLHKQHNIEFTYFSNNSSLPNGHYLDISNKDSTLKLFAKRPNVNLSNKKLNKTLGIKMKTIKEELNQMLQDKPSYD